GTTRYVPGRRRLRFFVRVSDVEYPLGPVTATVRGVPPLSPPTTIRRLPVLDVDLAATAADGEAAISAAWAGVTVATINPPANRRDTRRMALQSDFRSLTQMLWWCVAVSAAPQQG